MARRYSLSETRFVIVENSNDDEFFAIKILEEGTNKVAMFTSVRWIHFTKVINQIEDSVVLLLARNYVKLNLHIGGRWYVSVTTGFPCIDFRLFYHNTVHGPRPTKTGIALRTGEWSRLRSEIIPQIFNDYPTLKSVRLCSEQPDHVNQKGRLMCRECTPFLFDEMLHSTM